jgi:hypothetical protein
VIAIAEFAAELAEVLTRSGRMESAEEKFSRRFSQHLLKHQVVVAGPPPFRKSR